MLDNNSWQIGVSDFGGYTTFVIYEGQDEMVDGVLYKKFFDPLNTVIYLREDIIERKVYRLIGGTEQLLYDFTLEDGDTITLPNGITYNANVSQLQVVGGTRKYIILESNFVYGGFWLEGVGCLNYPLMPYYEMWSDPVFSVLCSAQNDVNVYNWGIAWNGVPADCSDLLSIETTTIENFGFYPNPCSDRLYFKLKSDLHDAEVVAYNMLGQIVNVRSGIQGTELSLDVSGLDNGLYIFQISQKGVVLVKQKIAVALIPN